MRFRNLTGQKFGRLVAIKLHHRDSRGRAHWEFLCDCGEKTIAGGHGVTSGKTQSCGCLNRESQLIRNTTHGMTGTHFYWKWGHMHGRCTNPNIERFKDYGGRGIKILWKSFEEFRDDMYESYLEHVKIHGKTDTTIERTDVDGDYSKENCTWATRKEQMRNKKSNRTLEHNGMKKCINEWVDITGLNRSTIYRRLRRGLSVENALTQSSLTRITK